MHTCTDAHLSINDWHGMISAPDQSLTQNNTYSVDDASNEEEEYFLARNHRQPGGTRPEEILLYGGMGAMKSAC